VPEHDEIIIRALALDGTWENIGADRASRVKPRDISLNADEGGPTSASFVLDREAGVRYPDIASLTPVEIEVPGLLAWDGRVTATPERRESGATSSIAVECEGWRAHLDDDPIDVPFLVHDNLSEWIDCRTIPGVSLARGVGFPSTGTVSTEGRSILMGLPRGAYLAQFDRVVGAQVDLGEATKPSVSSWRSTASALTSLATRTTRCFFAAPIPPLESRPALASWETTRTSEPSTSPPAAPSYKAP
jgi:hypothetical protein